MNYDEAFGLMSLDPETARRQLAARQTHAIRLSAGDGSNRGGLDDEVMSRLTRGRWYPGMRLSAEAPEKNGGDLVAGLRECAEQLNIVLPDDVSDLKTLLQYFLTAYKTKQANEPSRRKVPQADDLDDLDEEGLVEPNAPAARLSQGHAGCFVRGVRSGRCMDRRFNAAG